MMRAGLLALSVLLLSGCGSLGRSSPETPAAADPPAKQVLVPGNAFYSAAVAQGDTIWLAGVIGRSPTGNVREATRQAMDAVKDTVEKSGGSLASVVKCTVYLTDIDHYAAMNEVYAEYFEQVPPPARTAIAVSALPFGALVEITCVAAR